MKSLSPLNTHSPRDPEFASFGEQRGRRLHRVFRLAHGLPHGPVSTLTPDGRMQVKGKRHGALPE